MHAMPREKGKFLILFLFLTRRKEKLKYREKFTALLNTLLLYVFKQFLFTFFLLVLICMHYKH